ncbi:MAG: SpoIIE family protein phosphatase [Leptospiraceae bacterium]|nr:SpoIIE family protein phosphatase [Leptospiraceae bacterium]
MKLSLRSKLLSGFIIINLCSSFLLGFSMYSQSMNMFLNEFRNSKLTFAKYVASLVRGEEHRNFKNASSALDPHYKEIFKKILTIQKNEPSIKYVYTLNYDPQKDELYYAFDTSKLLNKHAVWVESDNLSFLVYLDKNLTFEYNSKIYSQAKLKDLTDEVIEIQAQTSETFSSLYWNGLELLKVKNLNPPEVQTPSGILNPQQKEVQVFIPSKHGQKSLLITLIEKGGLSSEPGLKFVESPELKDKLKKLIKTKTDYVDLEPFENSLGSFLGAYAIIKDEKEEASGIVVVEISGIEIDNFRNKFLIVAGSTSFLVFVVTLIISVFLSKYFTAPLEVLTKAVESLASGNLETYIEIPNKDEFGRLANSFNIMVNNLKTSSEIQYNLLIEISQLNENLEAKVRERTKKIEEQSQEIEKQIQTTRKIQLSLLPDEIPQIQSADVSFRYHPMMEVGGDFLDLDYRNDQLRLFMCDVSGHGIPAAFLATMVKMALQESFELGLNSTESLQKIYKSLRGKMKGHFLSACFCLIDLKTGLMRYANAGHLPLILSRKNGTTEFIPIKGRIINDLFTPSFEERNIQLRANDKIVLYTDGIVEARNKENEIFGEDRLLSIVKENKNLLPREICEIVYSRVIQFVDNSSPHFADDITILVAEYKP